MSPFFVHCHSYNRNRKYQKGQYSRKELQMRTIELPPYAPTLIESTRAIGYSLEAAVADIIDNSIAASAKNVDIFFFSCRRRIYSHS